MSVTSSAAELIHAERASGARSRRALLAPGTLLRVEGAVLALVGVALFARTGTSWWLFAVLLLAPDLGLLGYLAGARIGAASYNFTHGLVLPGVVGMTVWWVESSTPVAVALIWVVHIGVDRAVGYGLKYETDFRDTHLQRADVK